MNLNKVDSRSSSFAWFQTAIESPSKLWYYLRGDVEEFNLQARIYHSICIITTAVMVYNVPFCFIIGMHNSAWITLGLLPIQFFIFYLSRFANKTTLSVSIYATIINVFFCINYFANSGIGGSTLLSFCLVYFLTIAIVPPSQYIWWTAVNIMVVGGLILWEFNHPEVKMISYPTRKDLFIDMSSTYIVSVLLMFACLSYIISNYGEEKKKVEKQRDILHEMGMQKSRFISIISHDFNTPLDQIRKYLWILSRVDLEAEQRKVYEQDLSRATLDTQNLLLNLLNWAKRSLNSSDILMEPVSILEAISDTLNIYRVIAKEKGAELKVSLDPDMKVWGSYEMIDVVLRNLISNSIKFTQEGGLIEVRSVEDDDDLKIIVSDNGPGITPEKQSQIFNPEIAPTYGTSNEKGIGLGLALCKEFVEKMKGTIGFESDERGTAFWVMLPKVEQEALIH